MELSNRLVLVTGAGRGIGREIALHFAREGCRMALVDINAQDLSHTAEAISQITEACTYIADISDEKSVETLFEEVNAQQGSIQILINNAGILKDSFLIKRKEGITHKLPLENWQAVINVNLTGTFLCSREFAAQLPEGESGCIINMSSLAKSGNAGQSSYSATKSAVAALTVCWSQELARYGIRVAGIAPGFIETDMTAGIRPDIRESLKNSIPLKELGKASDIAQTAVFIAKNDYLSGRVLEIDGGARL